MAADGGPSSAVRLNLGKQHIPAYYDINLPRQSQRLIGRVTLLRLNQGDKAAIQGAQKGDGGVDLALFPLVEDDAEHLPDVFHAFKMIALVAEHVDKADDAPTLKLLEAGADVGARDAERLDAHQGVALRYVDTRGQATQLFPANPNGSPHAIAAVCSEDGRVTIAMPHPERVYRAAQNSWRPAEWTEDGGWMRMFRNARVALG